jgi:hypothetical protein
LASLEHRFAPRQPSPAPGDNSPNFHSGPHLLSLGSSGETEEPPCAMADMSKDNMIIRKFGT